MTMKRFSFVMLALTLLAAAPAASAQTSAAEETAGNVRVEGRVVAIEHVEQATRNHGQGAADMIRIRTRSGEEMHLVLGPQGVCDGCLRVGDQVRVHARPTGANAGGEAARYEVRTMTVRRTGRTLHFGDGPAARAGMGAADGMGPGSHQRAGDRTRMHQRDRIHTPGTGAGTGAGAGHRHGGGGRR